LAYAILSSPFIVEIQDAPLSGVVLRELTRSLLMYGKAFRFIAHGYSMEPFIHDGDAITVAPLESPPSLGEVVAFVNPCNHRLTVHRIIACTPQGHIIKGDNLPDSDGLMTHKHILGRISRIERRGKNVPWVLGPIGVAIAFLSRYNLLLTARRAYYFPRHVAGIILRRLQGLQIYPAITKPWAPRINIGEPSQTELIKVYRHLMPGVWRQLQPSESHVTHFVAKTSRSVAGYVELIRYPPEHALFAGYWLFSLHVWNRYRRLGIGMHLTRRVMTLARNEGAEELLLLVRESNTEAIDMYRKLGFTRCIRPALDQQLAQETPRRIVMSVPLTKDLETPCNNMKSSNSPFGTV
jgi:ribosomal protein S18 acetylase RimI-like enzyme